MLTIVGLGPYSFERMSLEAREALEAAARSGARVLVRTARHPAVDALAARGLLQGHEGLDALYESGASFEEVYARIVERVLDAARAGHALYAVPGHPLVAEETVRRILAAARGEGLEVRVIGSESFIEPALTALGVSLADGLVLRDALTLATAEVRPDLPLLLYQVYDQAVASETKLALMREFPDDWEVSVVSGGGGETTGEAGAARVERVALHRLDRVPVDHLTTVYVPALPPERRRKRFEDLVEVMARLRGPGGCPWDQEQDHSTLKRYMIEECYEAVEAIENDDLDSLREELGDVLLQVVFHAQLQAETGLFTIDDVVAAIVEKLVRRHPHVFGTLSVEDSDEVLRNWERIKKEEKGTGWRESALDGVPAGLPALMRALEISKRAVKVGFEWDRVEDVLAKLDEEVAELREAVAAGDRSEIASELGDLLFTVVNLARWHKVDPEEALRGMVARFSARFRFMEREAAARGRRLEEMSLDEMDALWELAKARGAGRPDAAQQPNG